MAIELSQFGEVFFEESFEGLQSMEADLLELEPDDNETINSIFRAAHSIKGGAGMFGFTAVQDFTHLVETLLDEMRNGRRPVTRDSVSLLLKAADCIRELLEQARAGEEGAPASVADVQQQLSDLLDCDAGSSAQASAPAEATSCGWKIRFKPFPEMLQRGNEPLRMLEALSELGELSVKLDEEKLPDLEQIDSESCYLGWTLSLCGDVPLADVQEVFDWVEDECELQIDPIQAAPQPDVVAPEADVPKEDTAVESPAEADSGDRRQSPVDTRSPEEKAAQGERRKGDRRASEAGSIRVATDKVDGLINRVGELVITQSMLGQIGLTEDTFDIAQLEILRLGITQLERNTRELQEDVMRIRMLPISFVFNRFPRLVRDLQDKLGKQITLKMMGEQTELDKTLMEKISDPMVHLVRNSIDHGIEMPEQRLAAGKPEGGEVCLNAYHQGGNIVIEIRDDGKGLDAERILQKARDKGLVAPDEHLEPAQIYDLIFHPGFSTADQVSDLSGRGVGMDVVRRNINELGGHVSLDSTPGKGCCVRITLPLTLAILDGQLVRAGGQTFILPLISIIESISVTEQEINGLAGVNQLYAFRGEYLPVIRLRQAMGLPSQPNEQLGLLVIVEGGSQRFGLWVDDLLSQQQVVIKSLEENLYRVDGVAGATILGDGSVALILDVGALLNLAGRGRSH